MSESLRTSPTTPNGPTKEMRQTPATSTAPPRPGSRSRLEGALIDALDLYFEQLGPQKPHPLHNMVIVAIEKPLIHYALNRCQGNLSKTATLLGITRNTLRKKIIQLQIQPQPPES